MANTDGANAGRTNTQPTPVPVSAAGVESKHGETLPHGAVGCLGLKQGLPPVFGRYRVQKYLGGGGMGAVYLVVNTELEREEALKVPHFDAADDPAVRERFLREAKAAARLDHPNLCPVYDVGVLDGVYYLTMRYLKGKLLSEYSGTAQPPRKAVEIVTKLAQALAAAHAKGVIHRDLKPNNVMMCAGVGPVVMDFGLAKQTGRQDRTLTQLGTTLGTPAYMPPEQVKGELDQMGPASDVYSLGVILFELLTGRLPFEAGTAAEVYGKILYTEAPSPSSLRPGLPAALDAICAKATAKAPEGRYASMKEFAAALIEYLKAAPSAERAGNLTAAKTGPVDIFQMETVAPKRVKATPPLRRSKILAVATQIGARASSPIRKSDGAHQGNLRATVVAGADEERGRRSSGAIFVWALCGVLILGGLGGIGALVCVINSRKAAPPSDVASAIPASPLATGKPEVVKPPQADFSAVRSDYQAFAAASLPVGTTEPYIRANAPLRLNDWEAAAKAGVPEGQYLTGRCLELGAGVAKDARRAVEWYRKAAEQGDAFAQNNLGRCYEYGEGVDHADMTEAIKWYRKAAEQGNAMAQTNLGICYEQGQGVDHKDAAAALQWYRKAAEQGCVLAEDYLGLRYLHGTGVVADANEAVSWLRKAAEKGNADAQTSLGWCYQQGSGVAVDLNEAVKWYRKAAEQDYAIAQDNLGACYENGNGVAADPKVAVEWYHKAADQGYAPAQYNLCQCYANGNGVAADPKVAVEWCRKAAEQGHINAQYHLGECYRTAFGVEADLHEAASWYRKAAEQGDADAEYSLGLCYENGSGGVEKSTAKAIEWYNKAAAQGQELAKTRLDQILGSSSADPPRDPGPNPSGSAQGGEPVFHHGLKIRVRKHDEKDFTDKTKKVGLEFFLDGPNGNGVYIGDAGDLATVAAKLVAPEDAKVKAPEWSHGMELRARKAGEKEFTKDTKKYGIEVFVDANNGNYLYLCETGATDCVAGKVGTAKPPKDPVKAPDWKNAMELRVRKAGEPDFNDKTKKIGVEVFLDPSNGNVVYISETGSIAVLPAKLVKMDESRRVPDWKHGMELAARKGDEKEFSKDTKRYGIEVVLDPYAGAVIYVCETGSIAVVPASLCTLPDAGTQVQTPDWKRAMVLSCRKAGESDIRTVKRYGVEVFLDPNTGNTVYISETGSLAVVPAKDM